MKKSIVLPDDLYIQPSMDANQSGAHHQYVGMVCQRESLPPSVQWDGRRVLWLVFDQKERLFREDHLGIDGRP